MGVGAGLSMYVVVVQKFTFAISSPDEFLSYLTPSIMPAEIVRMYVVEQRNAAGIMISLSVCCIPDARLQSMESRQK